MRRKVPTVIKVKAFLAIALPLLFLALIGIGFIPIFEDGATLWNKVGQKFFGGDDDGLDRRSTRDPVRVEKKDVASLVERAQSDDRGTLMGAGMDIEEALREIGNSEDPKLVETRKQLEALLAEVQKKLAVGVAPKSDVIIPSGKSKPK